MKQLDEIFTNLVDAGIPIKINKWYFFKINWNIWDEWSKPVAQKFSKRTSHPSETQNRGRTKHNSGLS